MNSKDLDEKELLKLLDLAKEGEYKLKEMSDFATAMAEKWQRKAKV